MTGHKVLEESQVLLSLGVVGLDKHSGDCFNLLESIVLRKALLGILRLSVLGNEVIRLLGHAALLMALSVSVMRIHVMEGVCLAVPLFQELVELQTLSYVSCGHTLQTQWILSNKRHSIFFWCCGLVCRQSMAGSVCGLNLACEWCLIKRLVSLDRLLLLHSLWC